MKKEGKGEYGPVTLISTVIGTVIGSGIFFKSEEILKITNGNALLGLLAFVAGGGIMLICAWTFAILSAEGGSPGGIVGYAEKLCGNSFAMFTALFSADFYLPSMTATLALVSAKYFCSLCGAGESPVLRVSVAGLFLVMSFAVNTLAPRGAGRFQVVSTVLKLLPLLTVGAVGCFAIFGGDSGIGGGYAPSGNGFMSALLSAAFAYEGWIAVTALDGEVRDAKKNIPMALTVGAIAVLAIYLFYYFGVIGQSAGADSVAAFENIFGRSGGRLMLVFVAVSCLGALNGLTMSTVRGHYILSEYLRVNSERRGIFGEVSRKTGIPVLSGIMGLLVSEIWLLYCVVSEMTEDSLVFAVDPAEASISVMYGIYIPIFIAMSVKGHGLSPVKRYVLPLGAAMASIFIAISSPISFGYAMLIFLFAVAVAATAVFSFYRR